MKVPEPRKLPSGSWFIQLRLGGESVPVTEATKKDCIKTATLIKAEHLSGRKVRGRNTARTLGEAIDAYIETNSRTLSPSTLRGYDVIRKNRFLRLMGKPIGRPSAAEWQAAINEDAADVSPKTIKNSWALVARVLAKNGMTVPDVILPQLIVKEHLWLKPDQILTFVEAVKDTDVCVPALLALHSLRRSEIFAVAETGSIDADAGLIYVRGAVVPNKDGELVYKQQNKSRASTRTVRIKIPALTEALKAGKPILAGSRHTLERRINAVCRKAGLPEVGIHGLRHSFASLAYHLGWPELYTIREGGWTDSRTVHEIYTHLDVEDALSRDKTMERFFAGISNCNANENHGRTEK